MKIGRRLGVSFLCGIIAISAGEIVYWYRLERRVPSYSSTIPRTKWIRALDHSYVISTPPMVGHDGTLYVATGNAIHALDPSSAAKWVYRVDSADAILSGTLAEDEADNLYFATVKSVYSLSSSGLKRWQADCSNGALAQNGWGEPFDANAVYATCETHFSALNKSDGRETWRLPQFQTQAPPSRPFPPLILKSGRIVFSRNQRIIATDRDGNTLWTYPADNLNAAYFLGAGPDETIYVRKAFASELVSLEPDGNVKWTFDGGAEVGFNEPPVTGPDGTVFITGVRGPVFALASDGTLKWKFRLPANTTADGYAAPVLGSDGTLYQLLEDRVIALSPQGTMMWQLQVPGELHHRGFLVFAIEGTLYAVMEDSVVYAIQTRN
jgi:outer membrane protein assembly factor BamB